MDLDEEGCLKNVFWADARNKVAFREFGDVVTFNTTYLINKYGIPFVAFVGVNHHEQSVLLGCIFNTTLLLLFGYFSHDLNVCLNVHLMQ